MADNEVISDIATPEPDLALHDSGSVGTALAVIDHRPEEAAPAPLVDATPEGSQADALEQQNEPDIELDTANSLPASPIERDMQVLFQILAICLLFHDLEETAYARYSVRVEGRLV